MKRSAKRPYHHGDLAAALVDTAVELIAERGVAGFSMAEASRRLGVTVAAPYRHFADRDALLAAVAAKAATDLTAAVAVEASAVPEPTDRIAAAARGYVRFASANAALFQALFAAGLDKRARPELEEAARPLVEDFFHGPATSLFDGDEQAGEALALAVLATAHGHAMLLLDGAFGPDTDAVGQAMARAHAAALGLVSGREALRSADLPTKVAGK